MGWLSAVGVCQAIHRKLIRHALGSRCLKDEVLLEREVRKGCPFPLRLGQMVELYWSLYIDELM